MTDVLKFPLAFENGKAATVEQDSDTERSQRALLLLSYPLGACVDLPPFGTADLAFGQGGADLRLIEATLSLWEPDLEATVSRELLDEAIDNLNVNIASEGPGA